MDSKLHTNFPLGSQQKINALDSLPERKSWFKSGWRVGATSAAALATLSLALNLIATVFISKHSKFTAGISSIYTGNCEMVEKYDTWIHLAINVVSTALLSGSNYCMQVLCAPNRKEVDDAHARKRYMDIGVPSSRNLTLIRKEKLLLWCLLGLSSLPLHLMYNSMFFGSLSTNDYNIYYVTEDFLTGAAYNRVAFPDKINGLDEDYMDTSAMQQRLQQNNGTWQKLSNAECISAYAVDTLSAHRDVVIVVEPQNTTRKGSMVSRDRYRFNFNSELEMDYYNPYDWICVDPMLAEKFIAQGWSLSYRCYQTIPQLKKLLISGLLAITTLDIIFCMSYVAWGIKDSPLITVGDAVASFLRRTDSTTRGACLIDGTYFQQHWRDDGDDDHGISSTEREYILGSEPMVLEGRSRRLKDAASKGRWFSMAGLLSAALIIVAGLLAYGIEHLKTSDRSMSALWAMGFGTVREESLIGGSGWHMPSVTAAVIVANLPQVMLSFLYLLFNGLLTAMLAAREWSHYAQERKPLRVSTPKGMQRSTYFLSLPYRFAAPLLVLSGALHWLVSQSLFLASITTELRDGRTLAEDPVSTCGYSPIAMVLTLSVGCLMLVGIVGVGFWKVSADLPIVGSCSAAISAACHPPPGQENAHLLPLQWGVIPRADGDEVSHCSFSAEEVEAPVVGAKYA
ncbi:hypothetical protein M438DRAFT_386109 [Aureobasidium pullulans EXF-150]|uniref:DUF6536 domain-containing protein n=1 Tax=Aureobasidium pullulans EXF-150 TaxID=1043002 RepID=A0A074X3T1_AURPU|nr:uncharacterized protein M438DRAFT_386109 [Aureobasidium pullulans EXF-150]KEQ80063.1 hypothetical protein M438DRAFT_386109 [Aureobasidium pullulans EXF-150]